VTQTKYPAIYIMASNRNGTLYVGVTSNLVKRVYEHKNNEIEGFTSKYQCHTLVYYECFEDMDQASEREKQIKSGSRLKKVRLIEKDNPDWNDLYSKLL
jgi:putative endonuclease